MSSSPDLLLPARQLTKMNSGTKKNLQLRADAEYSATKARADLAKQAKALNLDAIHDIVHEVGRDEAMHSKAFAGLLKRYFGKKGVELIC